MLGPGEPGHAEQAREDAAHDAADAVAAEGVQRVVVAEAPLSLGDGPIHDGTHDQPHDDRRPGLHEPGCRGDDHKTGHQARRRADERALPHRDALGKHPREHAGRAGRHGVQQRESSHAVGRELAARVEPEPAEPQKRRAQGHERHIVGTVGQHGEALATPQHEAQDESGEARGDVHHVAAGEVQGPDHVADERAVAAPHHVRQRRVHHDDPHGHERAHGAELHAPGHRTGNDGAGDHGKGHLEDDVDDGRVARCHLRVIGQRTLAGQHREGIGRALGLGHHVVHGAQAPDLVEAAEERQRPVAAVGERPAAHDPNHPDNAEHTEHHHHGVHDVLAAGETPIEEGESGRHEQHQHGADEHEPGGTGVNHRDQPLSQFAGPRRKEVGRRRAPHRAGLPTPCRPRRPTARTTRLFHGTW